jgi:serine/threonine protein kinase
MPPEVFIGQVYDTRSDVFSFGMRFRNFFLSPCVLFLSRAHYLILMDIAVTVCSRQIVGMVLWELLTGLVPFGDIPPLMVCKLNFFFSPQSLLWMTRFRRFTS